MASITLEIFFQVENRTKGAVMKVVLDVDVHVDE